LTESYPVTVRGKEYPDAEAAYQALKGTATKDDGPNSTYNLMVEILKAKLEKYPRLVSEIDKAGGKSWLSKATHQPTSRNTVWETGGKNWFIKALTDAYLSVKGPDSIATEENIEPTKESGLKKAQDILNSVSSIKDLPNLNAVNGNPFTFKLLDLISSGEVTSKEIIDMVEKRRQELSENLSLNDIKTGDIVIFTDGRKGIVKSMTKDAIKVKVFNSKSKSLDVVPAAEISKKIKMVENGKIAAVEETVQVEVAPENKPEVEASKDTVDSFTSDAARVKNAINDVMANTGKDNSNNIQNIIDNMGCKTKGA